MDETLEALPGQGEEKTVTSRRLRRECDVCGEPAHYKHAFLLAGGRSNPNSKAYGQDDCSWCEDDCRFVCKEHKNDRSPPEGTRWCATFPASERFAHMFLYWKAV